MEQAAEYIGWTVAILAGCGTLWVFARKIIKKFRQASATLNEVTDVLLGRPAIVDPETSEVLAEERPGIGTRMASIERWQLEVVPILRQLADTQAEMVRTNARVDRLDYIVNDHLRSRH